MEEYGAGDLILVTQPWIWCLTDSKLNELCSHCLRDLPNSRDRVAPAITCAGCNVVQFCCLQCQMDANNAYHTDECLYIRRLSRLPGLTCVTTTSTSNATPTAGDDNDTYFYISRLMLRMIFRILHNDTFSLEFFEDDRFNRDFLKTLVSHWDEHVKHDFQHQRVIGRLLWAMKSIFDFTLSDADRRVETDMLHCAKRQTGGGGGVEATARSAEIVTDVKTEEMVKIRPTQHQNELTAVERQRLQELLTFDMFGPLYARVSINSIAIQTMEFEKLGGAVYLSASVFDHSCAPNASRCFNGRELVVRATQAIHSVEDVRIAYVDVLMPTWKRQTALKRHYYFDCTCTRCASAADEQLLYGVRCPFARHNNDDGEAIVAAAADSETSIETASSGSRPAGDKCVDGEFKLLPRYDEFASTTSGGSATVASNSAAAAAVKRKAPLEAVSRQSSLNLVSARSSFASVPSTTGDDTNIVCPACHQRVPLQYVQRVMTLYTICQKVMLAYDTVGRRCAEHQHKLSSEPAAGGTRPSITACYDAVNQQAAQMQRVVEQAERYLGPHHELLLELRDRLAAYCMHRSQFDRAYAYYSKTLPTVARLLGCNSITHEYTTQLMRTATAAYRSSSTSTSNALRLAVKSLELQAFLFGADSDWFKEWSQACLSMESRLRATGQPSPLIHPASLISAALANQSLRAAAYNDAYKHREKADDTIFIEQLLAKKDSQHAEELSKQQKAAALAASMAAAAAAAAAERWVRATAANNKNNNFDLKESDGSVSGSPSVVSSEHMLAPEPTMRPFSSKRNPIMEAKSPQLNSPTLRRQQQLFATRTMANRAVLLNRTGKLPSNPSSNTNTAPSVAALKIMKRASTRLPNAREEQQQLLHAQRANENLRRRAAPQQHEQTGEEEKEEPVENAHGTPTVVAAGGGGGDAGHVVADLMDELQTTWATSVESFKLQEAVRGLAVGNVPESVVAESATFSSSSVEWLERLPAGFDQLSLSQATSDVESTLWKP